MYICRPGLLRCRLILYRLSHKGSPHVSVIHSILLLNSIPWNGVNHGLFNHSPIEGHMGYFQILFMQQTFVFKFLHEIYFLLLWNKWAWVQLLDHMVSMFLVLQENDCFPEWLYQFSFPPAVCEWSRSSMSSTTTVIISVVWREDILMVCSDSTSWF